MNSSCVYDAGLNSYELRVSGQLVPSEAERMDHPQHSPGKEGHFQAFIQLETGERFTRLLLAYSFFHG